jgi:hypothetical protein
MESNKNLSELIFKLSNWSNIMPFLGYYDQIFILYTSLWKQARKQWTEVEKGILETVLKENMRIHPFFNKDQFYTVTEILRVYKGNCNKYFLCPPIQINVNVNIEKQVLDGTLFNFTKIHLNNNFDWVKVNSHYTELLGVPSIQDSMITISTNQWPNEEVKEPPWMNVLDIQYYQPPLSLENLVTNLNNYGRPVRSIILQMGEGQETSEEKLDESIREGLKEITLRWVNSALSDSYIDWVDSIRNTIGRLNDPPTKITIESQRDTFENFIATIASKVIDDTIEYAMTSQYYQNIGFNMEITAEDCTVPYESISASAKSFKVKYLQFTVDIQPIFHTIDGVEHLAIPSVCKKTMYGVKLGETKTESFNFDKQGNLANFYFMFVPVDSITKFKATLFNRENSELITNLPEYLDHFQWELDLWIGNPTVDNAVEGILPLLSQKKISNLYLDLNYTTEELFQEIKRYLDNSNKHLKEFKMHIFNQFEFESILDTIYQRKKLNRAHLVMHNEAMINVSKHIFALKTKNPFVDFIPEYVVPREKTFTIRQKLKELMDRRAQA